MNFIFPQDHHEITSCVFKLSIGKKYLYVKSKSLASGIFFIEKGYQSFIARGGYKGSKSFGKGQKEGHTKNTLYWRLYKLIHANPTTPIEVEVIIESLDAYELLKTEHELLEKSAKDKNCINNNIYPYIPKYNSKANAYNWIPVDVVEKYLREFEFVKRNQIIDHPIHIPLLYFP